jgi:hypothetical protein
MLISQCILLQLLAGPPLLWQEHAWVRAGVAADSVPRRKCPPGHYPLADYVPPDTIR